MADQFPDPDDEYDLVHEDEYELLKEIEEKSCRKQLIFSQNGDSGASDKPLQKQQVADKIPSLTTRISTQSPPIENGNNTRPTTNNNNNKRTIDDLFGDIGDLIDDHDLQSVLCDEPKSKKLRWDREDELMNRIVAGRQLRTGMWKSMDEYSVEPKDNRKNSISMRVPPWNFVAVTRCSDCQRLYVRVKNDSKFSVVKSRPASGLLSASFSKLKAEAEEIMVKIASKLSEESTESELIPAAFGNELWVDKYRPCKYRELLSEESINRTFLHWLKLWDKIVFHRNPVVRKIPETSTKFGPEKFTKQNIGGLDDKGFPVQRIVLLSGPPGLGKTTLAHLAAHSAGYNVIEVNASSDRGTKEFKAALYSSTQMKAVLGKDPRPNCLVMDEVDGAPAASIDILLKFVQGKLNEDDDGAARKKKKEAKKESLGCRRPVICICNDAYAPSLWALRPLALVIPVSGVSAGRLADRLMEILRRQNLDADSGVLIELAEQSGCDVRACLGALQYMGGVKAGQKLSIAPKDVRRGIFDCWKQILQVPRNKSGPLPMKERIQSVLQVAYGGETELLARGVFHNYPEVVFRDEGMEVVAKTLDWFQLYDEINHSVMSRQTWSLMPYTNYAFVACHLSFAGMNNPKLAFPTAENEVNQKIARTDAILKITRQVSGIDRMALIFDVAPLLTDLLTPSLRSVSYHLYSTNEKANLTRLVNVLVDLGLNLVEYKTPEGGYVHNLEPNLEEVGTFADCKMRQSLSYDVKRIVVRELAVARLKKFGDGTAASPEKRTQAGTSTSPKTLTNSYKQTTQTVPNHLVRLQPIARNIRDEPRQCRDFFGRIVVVTPQNKTGTTGKKDEVSPGTKRALSQRDIWFKYKEGYSNAVRLKVRIRDLE